MHWTIGLTGYIGPLTITLSLVCSSGRFQFPYSRMHYCVTGFQASHQMIRLHHKVWLRFRAGKLSSTSSSSQGESGLHSGYRSRGGRRLRSTGVSTELQRRLRVHHYTCRYSRYRWKHYHVVWHSDRLPVASSAAEHHAAVLLRYTMACTSTAKERLEKNKKILFRVSN